MAAAPQQGSSDNSLGFLWVLIGAFLAIYLLWSQFHAPLVAIIFKIKLFEIALMSFFTGGLDEVRSWIQAASPGAVSISQVGEVSEIIGRVIRYPITILLAIFAIVVYFGNVTMRFTTVFNMQRLLDRSKHIWPQTTPIVRLDLDKVDLEKGAWAMAKQPFSFVKKHHLSEEKELISVRIGSGRHAKYTIKLKPGASHSVFVQQLGKRWTGIETLNAHTKALFAAFSARIGRDGPGSMKFLDQISASSATGKLDFSGTTELLRKHIKNPEIGKVIGGHAFVFTVMAAMLEKAREDGVLATADFLWLKPVDRLLWYILNSVGRQTVVPEVAGAYAHWVAELELGRKINVPMVDEAVTGLELAIADQYYSPEDVEDI